MLFPLSALAVLVSTFAPDTQALSSDLDGGMLLHISSSILAYAVLTLAAVQSALLALQDQVTQTQIINRLKEQYGDRQTVSRYARFVIRSFVAWGVLKDSLAKGCYEKSIPMNITDLDLAILMLESALLSTPSAKSALGLIVNNPAYFPFNLPSIGADTVGKRSNRIEVDRYGFGDEFLKLKS